jgi:6-pyruvoyltetrahydropterin/6-carboxytetrahydropterin synthase
MTERFEMLRTMHFEAAHHLPHTPAEHKCHRVHGHSFEAEAAVSGDLIQPEGWIMDFAELSDLLEGIRADLDHRLLNDIPGLENPTSEELARWIWLRLTPHLPDGVLLTRVSVRETCQSAVSYEARPAGAQHP